MAARTRTLAQLRSDVRVRAAIESDLGFYPDAILNRWLNESWQDLRVELSNGDVEMFLDSETGTTTSGASSGRAFGSIAYPSDAVAIYGLDITLDGRVCDLAPIGFEARNDYQSGPTKTGTPAGYRVLNIGTESTTTVSAGEILLVPAPSSALAYTVWYLPAWVDVTTDAHVFNCQGGTEQWVIWDTCVKVAIRGNDAKNQRVGFESERARAMARIMKGAKRLNRSGPVKRRDVRAERHTYR